MPDPLPPPRGAEDRIRWFLANKPSGPGMCAQHSWHALGGDRGNPPRWYAANANAVYDKVRAAGRYWTSDPPRGALVLWEYGTNGHAALSLGDGRIATTDATGSRNGEPGIEPIGYPAKWGASPIKRIWTDTYNGVRFGVGSEMTTSGTAPRKTLDPWPVGKSCMIKVGASTKPNWVTVKGGKWVTLAIIDLPAGADFLVTEQVRMPKGLAAGEARLARLGWGAAAPGAVDATGHNPIPPGTIVSRWRTPIQGHPMAGGGPLAFQVHLPEGVHRLRFVAKALRVA
jgi:hypothetical protein